MTEEIASIICSLLSTIIMQIYYRHCNSCIFSFFIFAFTIRMSAASYVTFNFTEKTFVKVIVIVDVLVTVCHVEEYLWLTHYFIARASYLLRCLVLTSR